jgi:molybdate transport system ATP-binding protein
MKFSIQGAWHQHQLDFQGSFAPGERVALLGVSGAGKTTLLRLLAGLDRLPQAQAQIEIAGQALGRAWQSPASLMHQQPVMFAHHRVEQTVLFGARFRPAAHRLPLQEWAQALDLTDLWQQPCAQLSGGQQQRVALLRTLMSQPAWLLLDESFAALDDLRRVRACEVVADYCRRTGAGLVLASHNDSPQRILCDSAYTVDKLTGRYQPNLFDRLNRVGSEGGMTTLTGTAEQLAQGFLRLQVDRQALYVAVPDPWQPGRARISLDASEISIALGDQHQTSMVNRLRVTVDSLVPIDGERVAVGLGLHQQSFVAIISLWSWQRLELILGQTVFAEFKVAAVQWHGQTH